MLRLALFVQKKFLVSCSACGGSPLRFDFGSAGLGLFCVFFISFENSVKVGHVVHSFQVKVDSIWLGSNGFFGYSCGLFYPLNIIHDVLCLSKFFSDLVCLLPNNFIYHKWLLRIIYCSILSSTPWSTVAIRPCLAELCLTFVCVAFAGSFNKTSAATPCKEGSFDFSIKTITG